MEHDALPTQKTESETIKDFVRSRVPTKPVHTEAKVLALTLLAGVVISVCFVVLFTEELVSLRIGTRTPPAQQTEEDLLRTSFATLVEAEYVAAVVEALEVAEDLEVNISGTPAPQTMYN
jgi:hypothetical protein